MVEQEKATNLYARLTASNGENQQTMSRLLAMLSLQHSANTNSGEALIDIFFRKGLPDLLDFNKKKCRAGGKLKKFIPIYEMDISFSFDVMKKVNDFETSILLHGKHSIDSRCHKPTYKPCCDRCDGHKCPSCKEEQCDRSCPVSCKDCMNHKCGCTKTRSLCIEINCANCVSKPMERQCGFIRCCKGLRFIKDNRNGTFHLTVKRCVSFLSGEPFEDFPDLKTAEDLLLKIKQSHQSILSFMCRTDYFNKPNNQAMRLQERANSIEKMDLIMKRNASEIEKSFPDLFVIIQKLNAENSNIKKTITQSQWMVAFVIFFVLALAFWHQFINTEWKNCPDSYQLKGVFKARIDDLEKSIKYNAVTSFLSFLCIAAIFLIFKGCFQEEVEIR